LRIRTCLMIVICAGLLSTAGWARSPHKSSSKGKHVAAKSHAKKHARSKSRHGRRSHRSRGQQEISADRVREIQEALIRVNYLSGEATGEMDARTKAALARFQADNGWQNKIVPDSRALIKLGLGPEHKNLLNPETAALSPDLSGSSSGNK